jgi:diacylglycerol kinase family enzyme
MNSVPRISETVRQLPASADHVLIAMNPRAGAGSAGPKVERLGTLLHEARLSTSVLTRMDEIIDRAGTLSSEGKLRAVIAAGGDGTVAEVINRVEAGTPVTVLPVGTENLLARYFGLSGRPETVAATVADGWVAPLDAGRAGGRLFLLMASAGFDAHVVARLHAGRKGNISHLSYLKPIVESIRTYDYPCLRIQASDIVSGDVQEVRACWAFVFNLPCYGFGLQIAPWASGLDGRLDLCAFRGGSFWHGLSYLGQVLCRSHRNCPETIITRATKLRIESDRPAPYQLDGDPGGMLPVEIEIVPNRLCLLVPRVWIESHYLPLAVTH